MAIFQSHHRPIHLEFLNLCLEIVLEPANVFFQWVCCLFQNVFFQWVCCLYQNVFFQWVCCLYQNVFFQWVCCPYQAPYFSTVTEHGLDLCIKYFKEY